MRLIDGDALYETLCHIWDRTDSEDFEKAVFEIIINAPIIEPERKKGIWKNRSLNILYPDWERYECSVCGGYSYNHKYCPNCGAKMEVEK